MMVACISAAVAAVALGFHLMLVTRGDWKPALMRLAKGFPFASFFVGVIGVAVGISFVTHEGLWSLGVGAVSGIVALVLCLAATITTLMIPVD
jgi:hypothetical protein